jgi:DegV family protein with EDD domain
MLLRGCHGRATPQRPQHESQVDRVPRIAIVADTDCSLPAPLAARHHIRQVPVNIHFGSHTYRTNEDIDDVGLFAMVEREGRLPTTSAPSPGQFAGAYQAAFDEGAEAVVCLCVSSLASATFDSAQAACELFPERPLTVIDTGVATLAQGFMALEAAEAAQEGLDAQAIVERALAVRSRTHLFAALSTLSYLARSGRVGQLAAGVAALLDVKPVLTMRDGKLEMLERVRTQSRAWARVLELAAAAAGGNPPRRVGIVHAAAAAQARSFEPLLRQALPCPDEIIVAELTPGLSSVSGPGLVGVVLEKG